MHIIRTDISPRPREAANDNGDFDPYHYAERGEINSPLSSD